MNDRSTVNFFRRLANRERLDVLEKVVLAALPGGLTVGEISDMIRLKQPATSQYLAQLENECGLIRSKREGRYVFYRFECDESFDVAMKIGASVRRYFRSRAKDNHFRNVPFVDPPFIPTFAALGNADRTRVAMLVRGRGETAKPEIQAALELTELNVRRHLAVLAELGLVERSERGFIWREPRDPVARLALDLANPVTYCNK